MIRNYKLVFSTILIVAFATSMASQVFSIELKQSKFQFQAPSVSSNFNLENEYSFLEAQDISEEFTSNDNSSSTKKSPTKAFLLSMAVPGLGQYYNGSKKRALAFASVEIVTLFFHFKWDGQANDLTDEFEAFNRAHWSRDAYIDYLWFQHGDSSDSNIDEKIFSHHLPNTNTQQYYEMTGKYDQFSWGWDDAMLFGADLYTHINGGVKNISVSNNVPFSANRLAYETMRNEANNKYDDARKMLMITAFNHVISSLEAFITTKNKNNKLADDEFALNISGDIKSYNRRMDTPFLSVRLKF